MTHTYNDMEMMIIAASRVLEEGASVSVGTGAPCAAAMLAQKTHAPNLLIEFENGGVNPILPEMPISVGDSRTYYKGMKASSMAYMMECCCTGLTDYTFLGGAQIDMYGNLNSTMIGQNYNHPKVRMPGSGGANDLASFCWRTLVLTVQDKRRFVEKVDFMTTPGWLKGGTSREDYGLPRGTGPYRVITNMGLMDYEPVSKRMRIIATNPGYSVKDIQDNCGFELLIADEIQKTPPPTKEELHSLRTEVDVHRYIIGRNAE